MDSMDYVMESKSNAEESVVETVEATVDDYEVEEKKQAAANVLTHYSQFVMTCIGEGVRPGQLRLHLMKEISGMPTSLNDPKEPPADKGQNSSKPSVVQGASSSDAFIRGDGAAKKGK